MDAEQARVLAELLAALGPLGLQPLLIGASASGCLATPEPSLPRQRSTKDLDVALRLEGWPQWHEVQSALESAGFSPDPGIEHRFIRNGVPVDLVPFGALAEKDPPQIQWPRAGSSMNVTGFEEAARSAVRISAAPGLEVACITVPGLVLLKAVAYLDRSSAGNPKYKSDAEDLLYWLENYASGHGDQRRFELGELPPDLAFDYWCAGAAVLGRELSGIVSPRSRALLGDLVVHALPPESRFWNVHYRPARDPGEINRRINTGIRLLRAFEWGLSLQGPK